MKEYTDLIRQPRQFFKSVAKEKISSTLKKTIPILIILYAIQAILNYFVNKEIYDKFQFPLIGNNFIVFYLLVGVIFLPLAIIISASLLHLSLKILRTKSSFSQNIKILIYPMILFYLISIIEHMLHLLIKNIYIQSALFLIIVLGSWIWSIILTVKGISEIYKVKTGKAIGAYFLQFGLIFGAFLALMILVILIVVIVALTFRGFK